MTVSLGAPTKKQISRVARLALCLVLCLSAFIQLTVASRSESTSPLTADAGRYFSYAYNVQQFGVYSSQITWDPAQAEGPLRPDAIRTPGYPLFLMLFPDVQPTTDFVRLVTFVQALIGIASVLLTYLVAVRVVPPMAAAGASLLAALSPHLATISTDILSESLFVFVLLVAAYFSIRAIETRRPLTIVAAGFSWGFCALVRPTAEFFPILVMAAFLLVPRLRPDLKLASLFVATFLAVLSPWIIRNHFSVTEASSDRLAINFLHHGSYPDFMFDGRPETLGFPYRYDPESAEIGSSVTRAVLNIRDNFRRDPITNVRWFLVGKPISFLSWNIVNGQGDIFTTRPARSPYLDDRLFAATRDFMWILHWPLMLLGLLGAATAWVKPHWIATNEASINGARFISAVVAYAIALHMVGTPFPRYGIPFRPLLYILAVSVLVAGVRAGVGRLKRRREGVNSAAHL